ncbi:transposase [Streptomyces erythrochromogenes]|uniref:transposase n=1 Tax=Streptomyces erythrochromogenes TaxID=285574 RepID=UPI0037CF536A
MPTACCGRACSRRRKRERGLSSRYVRVCGGVIGGPRSSGGPGTTPFWRRSSTAGEGRCSPNSKGDLTDWMARALDQGPQPIQGFAAFLQNDWDAVVNGLTLQWSSGAVEGQVTRIKLIERRSYGRASFAHLRTLVLAQPPRSPQHQPCRPCLVFTRTRSRSWAW